MNYKQAKKQYCVSIMNLVDWVETEAESDEGMPKWETIYFHKYNKKGLMNQFPCAEILKIEDFSFTNEEGDKGLAVGLLHTCTSHENYHVRILEKALSKHARNLKWWDIRYHLEQIKKDIDRAWEGVANTEFPIKAREIARARLSEIKNTEEVA
tara:strand:- start:3394 stop:3855 length:462 start_codon:yes stop_codon:yes gene_type:complete